MFRKITIEVTGGDARDLVVRLMRAVSEAIRMILEGATGVSLISALRKEQCEVTLEEFAPCTVLPESTTTIPDRKRENGY